MSGKEKGKKEKEKEVKKRKRVEDEAAQYHPFSAPLLLPINIYIYPN